MRPFIDALMGDSQGWIELRVPSLNGLTRFFPLTSEGRTEAMQAALELDRQEQDVFFGVLPRLRERGRAEDCSTLTSVLWADVDAKQHKESKAQALTALSRAQMEPSILVDSGHGWHAYWLLDEPVPFADATGVMQGLAKAIGGDRVWDAARILRLPGTRNWKSDPPVPVRLLRFAPKRRYRFSNFIDFIAKPEPVKVYASSVSEGWNLSKPDAPKFPEGERNNSLARIGGIMFARGMSPDEVEMNLLAENQIRCNPPLPDREVMAIARSLRRYA